MGVEDKIIWRPTKDSKFLVKSSYHLEFERHSLNKGETSNIEEGNNIGKPYEVCVFLELFKYFIWRACCDLLPTRTNLVKRKIIEDLRCPICKSIQESLIHALWDCPAARDVWGETCSPLRKWSFVVQDFWLLWVEIV